MRRSPQLSRRAERPARWSPGPAAASLAMARSDWSAAERFAQESEAIVTRAQLAHILPALSTYAVTARIAIHRGDLARAREELVRAQLVRPLATYAAPWVSVGALLELARAYLAIADPAGARNVVAEAEAIARRRPALGSSTRGWRTCGGGCVTRRAPLPDHRPSRRRSCDCFPSCRRR